MIDRAADLRAAFDRVFADAPAPAAAAQVDILRVRIADEPYAVALNEISALHVDLHVVPLPSPAPELLGVASARNAIVPVYDLRALLGAAAGPPPRWLVVGRGTPALAFAFDGFDGHARVDEHAIAKASGASVRGTVALDGRLHQVVDLSSLQTIIHTRWDKKG